MLNSELYLKCVELAMRPIKGISYNYDSLSTIIEQTFPDILTHEDRLIKMRELMDQSSFPWTLPLNEEGKIIPLDPEKLNFPIEKTPPMNFVFERADEIYSACLAKNNKASLRLDKDGYLTNNEAIVGPEIKIGDKFIDPEWYIEGDAPEEIFTVIKIGRTSCILETNVSANKVGIDGSIPYFPQSVFLKETLFNKNKFIRLGFIEWKEKEDQGENPERSVATDAQ